MSACDDATFSVAAAGKSPLTYQWLKDGNPIEGAVAATYAVQGATPDEDGARFSVVVTNSAGSVESDCAVLSVVGGSPHSTEPVVIADEGGWDIALNDMTVAWTTGTGVHAAPKLCAKPVRSLYERSSYQLSTSGIVLSADRAVWTDANNGSVWSAPLIGGPATLLVSLGEVGPYEIALAGAQLYWPHLSGGLRSMPLAGGPVTLVAPAQEADGIAVDDLYVYWNDIAQHTVNRMPLGGGPVAILATDTDSLAGIAADGRYVYWGATDQSTNPPTGYVRRVARDGGAPTVIANQPTETLRLAVDDMNVYWTAGVSPGTGSVSRVRSDGSQPPDLLISGINPFGIAVDAQYVYWVEPGGSAYGAGRIMRLAK